MGTSRLAVALAVLAGGAVLLGAQSSSPWFIQETSMTADGELTFREKPWWPRAAKLAEGESFTLDLNRDGRPDTIVERSGGHIIQTIDDSGRAADIRKSPDAAILVSYQGSGLVDRLIDYIDNNHDGKSDEMEIRYYKDGFLRYAWFGENFDHDGAQVWSLKDWQYDGDGFRSKFRGNVVFYLNKYDPATRAWAPVSECPFAFGDPNRDGRSEWVVRVSAAPLDSNTGSDTDYANNYDHIWAEKTTPLAGIGNLNVRLSYSLDPEPRTNPVEKPHFTFGFTMVGQQKYDYPGMLYTNPHRRPPQTVVRIPREAAESVALRYPAEQTGFSWDEAHAVDRWEGQFWIYERRLLYNTGGPTMRWNMRREYSGQPGTERRLYYSAVDKRHHLFGAAEGWLEAGHLLNQQKDLEIRTFDHDGDGFFDTWQVLAGQDTIPVRVSRVPEPRARMVKLSREMLAEEYNRRILPEAIAENGELIAALKKRAESSPAVSYEDEARKSAFAERKRYCLDVARELYFLKVRDALYAGNAGGPYPRLERSAGRRTLDTGTEDGRYTVGDSLAFWKQALAIEGFVVAYGEGRINDAREILERIPVAR